MEELAIFGGKPVRENKIFYGRQYIDQARRFRKLSGRMPVQRLNLYERIKFSTDGNILTRQMWTRWQQS